METTPLSKLEQAIQKAINSGYQGGYRYGKGIDFFSDDRHFLNPLFWQALGKEMGDNDFRSQPDLWLYHWHRLINYLADGKSVEEFFETL